MCMIADVVVVGGVRRSAMISLSDLGSEAMAKAKSGSWWEGHVHRQLANNSAVYNSKPDISEFLKEWKRCMTQNQANEVSSIETLLGGSLKSLENAIRTMTLVLTHAQRLSFDPFSSATSQKLLSEVATELTILNGRFGSLQFLARSSPPSRTSNTSEKSGKRTQKRNVS
jgi:hypothetical protein